ncbi:MAG: hypothetical protein QM755_04240 [Luteolibacter sp.]
MDEKHPPEDRRTPFEKMADLARKIVAVQKEEIDKREEEYQEERAVLRASKLKD